MHKHVSIHKKMYFHVSKTKIICYSFSEVNEMSVAENIRYLRKKKGMTQKQLAEASGLAIITIQQYEAGKYVPKNESLYKLRKALNCNIHEILNKPFEIPTISIDNLIEIDEGIFIPKQLADVTRLQIVDTVNKNDITHPADTSIRFLLTGDVKERQNKYDSIIAKHENGEPYTDEELKFIEEMNATLPDKMEQLAEKLRPIINRIQETTMKLNEKGMEKVAEHAEMLAKIPEYQRDFNSDNNTET